MKLKNILMSGLSLVLVAALAISGTVAYLQDDDSDVNVMTLGNVSIEQHEYERVVENGEYNYYEHDFLPNSCHGTGDIYASAFTGALIRGKTAFEAAKIAAIYTVECIRITAEEENHWYGAKFEPALKSLIDMI